MLSAILNHREVIAKNRNYITLIFTVPEYIINFVIDQKRVVI